MKRLFSSCCPNRRRAPAPARLMLDQTGRLVVLLIAMSATITLAPACANASDVARPAPQVASGGSALLDQTTQLLAELGRVFVAVNCHGVLHRRVEYLVLAVGRDRHRATYLARVLPAIDEFASHVSLLWSLSPTLLPEARRVNAGDVIGGGPAARPSRRPAGRRPPPTPRANHP